MCGFNSLSAKIWWQLNVYHSSFSIIIVFVIRLLIFGDQTKSLRLDHQQTNSI